MERWQNTRKVIVSREDVAHFNSRWPGSNLSPSRAYWFEFDTIGNLIDTDVPDHSDGPAAAALAQDALDWLEDQLDSADKAEAPAGNHWQA